MVEQPEFHILGRSGSSLEDQSSFIDCRRESLKDVDIPLVTATGGQLYDVVRFFRGDGPAQQFEAGNKIGGNYPCVGCEAHTGLFDDLGYTFRAKHLSLGERQSFILNGEAWKQNINPLSNLKVAELRKELKVRGFDVEQKKKPELQEQLENIQKGVANVPALLQNTPQAILKSLHLQSYEVFSSEPLHDLKGHLHHIIEECLVTGPATVNVKGSVLDKSTLQGSDYRQAVILIYKQLENTILEAYKQLFRTATDIASLLYSSDSERSPRNVLRLHNVTFIHGMLCTQLFGSSPRGSTLFGRYFHSIVCHAPLIYRLISLRSVNTENQERMFNQMKHDNKSHL